MVVRAPVQRRAVVIRDSLRLGGQSAMYQILLVDDDSPTQKVVKAMLEYYDCRVEVVKDGRDAVIAFSRRRYDVIFMDCQMPEMDGYEATGAIRKMETENRGSSQTGRIPIIAITGYAVEAERVRCVRAGMDDYLSKPFNIQDVESILERWLFSRTAPGGKGLQEEKASPRGDTPEETAGDAGVEDALPIDQNALDMIASLQPQGGDSVLRKVISLYLDSSLKLMKNIREAAEGNDSQALHRAAHTLKSSSAYLGAMTLSGICKELEIMGRDESPEGVEVRIAGLDREYRKVYASLEKRLKWPETGGTSLR
jgi:CheY-like chemotaxis protein/HPt (histidine-containing phosphotransfer) domain-containing protein